MTLVYVDTSVVLAALLGEPVRPPAEFWMQTDLLGSVLVEVETMTRLRAVTAPEQAMQAARGFLAALSMHPLDDAALAAARSGFPLGLRTLDALHLSTALVFGPEISMATYDRRLRDATIAVGLTIATGF